ncbi:hypothetical protein [Coralloluteibacterium thermophilus]|uniref:Uncharacterized protein n=1 Tax=Coralloluteibacterium thermophilum TaxID=2707049 RepID=A0ABV9NJB2_9GAMM
MRVTSFRGGLVAAALVCASTPALADYENFTIGAGFTPDPMTGSGQTGGNSDAARFGSRCTGRIDTSPDHTIRVTSTVDVRIRTESTTDSTLVVVGPAGVFCDDDGAGALDAQVDARLTPGDYQVYVGHLGEGGRYTLSISERIGGGPEDNRYGDFTLGAGFTPDPQTASGRTGGAVDASTHGSHCTGMIDSTPDHRLTITSPVNLRISVDSTTDSTLVVVGPGKVVCDDDSAGALDARIVDRFQPGEYGIYVGHLGDGGEYTLTISEEL